jgi:hypothetical protein
VAYLAQVRNPNPQTSAQTDGSRHG